jgi:solute:Na+ symporter, SSS family
VSLVTRAPPSALVERFYGKMKTRVGSTPELDAAAMAATHHNPRRLDTMKLFPNSNWEFTRWDRADAIGFLACCAISGAILAGLVALLRVAG